MFAEDSFSSLQSCCPDEGGHCKPLMSFTCGKVQKTFGISASMVLRGVFLCPGTEVLILDTIDSFIHSVQGSKELRKNLMLSCFAASLHACLYDSPLMLLH
jgi:hypothetical protein